MNLILSRMVQQYAEKHGKLPKQIVIDPLALIVLTHRKSIAPKWRGIPVVCRELQTRKPEGVCNALGIVAFRGDLRALDVCTT